MEQKKLIIDSRYYPRAMEEANVFHQPFKWLHGILVNMTGFKHPSGFAIINQNHIVTKIWAGDTNEYALYQEVEHIDKCVYIDNFEGPIRATWGWKNLSRSDIEETFSFRFDDNDLAELGGFPNNLIIVS